MAKGTEKLPNEKVHRWRKDWIHEVIDAVRGLGKLPLIIIIFFPRCTFSFAIVLLAQLGRACARLFSATTSFEKKANMRILIVTDYMPPQTHGIAIRFQQYIERMRMKGHEVQVFSTNLTKERETSFDHPNLPAIQNPFNRSNLMAYNPGVKLAWYLGAKQWDLVHVVYPTNIGLSVLPVCNWRRIPVYCSHHVDMEFYIGQYVKLKLIAWLGHFLYWLLVKLPAAKFANVNAAPTLCFLNTHMPSCSGTRSRIPSGVADARFRVDSSEQLEEERRELLRMAGAEPDAEMCILLMVQRLAPEKDSIHLLEALNGLKKQQPASNGKIRYHSQSSCTIGGWLSLDGKRRVHVLIAGDGPAKPSLTAYATQHQLPVTFLGNLKNDRLPPLYRAADVFVTCSTSETYGLTVLEALACGTPAVVPRCAVFDELWSGRIPPEWIYKHACPQALLQALRTASPGSATCNGKHYLASHPIKASWSDATDLLLEQYDEAIRAQLPYRKELATYTRAFNHFARVLLVAGMLWWISKMELRLALKLLTKFFD
mmetsp:Transcript_62363/g.103729  ORF Transcript_62363/g.103729 Transcript_62363/m.103729 type:complete len:541 (-) Transcript_62363:276-1898(-)